MPSAIAVPIRRQMIELRKQGKSYREIAQQLGQSRHSVRQICHRWRKGGEAALEPNYGQCGYRGITFERLVWRSAIYLKRRHPEWGGGFIRVKLQQRWPNHSIPSKRTLQRWFRVAEVDSAPMRAPIPRRARAKQVHQCWQVDAVSHQRLADGSEASWLSATDEASRALLACSAFPLCPI
ncbi:MAG: helix-turn-helix domain-containing protein [Cyanobacteria bacterium J06635_1]